MSHVPSPRPIRRRWTSMLDVGEASVASTGLVLAVILLCGMAASAWLVRTTQRDALLDVQRDRAVATTEAIRVGLETMLATGDLAEARRLIAGIARSVDLEECRVTLADGTIIADTNATSITARSLPDPLPTADLPDTDVRLSVDGITVTMPIAIGASGTAKLLVTSQVSPTDASIWSAQAAVGGVGALTLLMLLVLYRRLRHRFRAIGSIRDALLALQAGETEESALQVNERLGVEASAWNRLLDEKAELRKRDTRQRVIERVQDGGGVGQGTLNDTCDSMWIGMIIVDPSLTVQYINGAAAILLQTSLDDALGQPLANLIEDDAIVDHAEAAFTRRSQAKVSAELNRMDSSSDVIRVDVRPVQYAGSAHALVALEDITQLRMAEESRNALITQATHELRTPLTNIRMYVETAIDDGDDDPAVRGKALNVINQEACRLERIVGDMLSVAEIEAGAMQLAMDDVRIDALFQDLERDYAAQAQDRDIEMTFDLAPKLPVLQGDRDKLTLALHNLLGNALKYTEPGGRVVVRADVTETSFVVEIEDSGIGIAEEDLDRIFEKFQRARDSRLATIGGSGLGLALAREVIQRHGGDLTVESEVNVGSTFRVTLPLAAKGM